MVSPIQPAQTGGEGEARLGKPRHESDRPRIRAASPPLPPAVRETIDRIVPAGMTPFALFTTLARDPRLFERFVARGFLGRGHLSLRQRELVVLRTTARCGSEYEWGIHSHFFAGRCGFDTAQQSSLVQGDSADPCWADEGDRVLIDLCDALQATCAVDDALWERLSARFSDEAILELLILAGNYRSVAYLTNALRLPREPWAPAFADLEERTGARP